jgi:hypothetical protein
MKPTGRDIQWYYDIGQALLGEKLTSEERDLLTWQLADIKHLVAKVLARGRAAEPLILNFVELNTVMVFISTVAGLVWRFHSKGYHQADIMREGKAAKKSVVEATLREFVKDEYRPDRKGKGISKAVNLRLVAAGFDEVKDDVVYRRIRKLRFGLL